MKDITENMEKEYSIYELLKLRRNILNYIVPYSEKEIEWKVLTKDELQEFYDNNYTYYNDLVYWKDNKQKLPIGMHYLLFETFNNKRKYFIGTIPNNIGKRTIIGCIIFSDNCEVAVDKEDVTSIETVEINYFYQGNGLLNKMMKAFSQIVKKEQNIIVTQESPIGKKCQVMKHIKKNLYDNGFTKDIRFEDEINDDYVKKLNKRI